MDKSKNFTPAEALLGLLEWSTECSTCLIHKTPLYALLKILLTYYWLIVSLWSVATPRSLAVQLPSYYFPHFICLWFLLLKQVFYISPLKLFQNRTQFAKIVLHWISFMQGMCYSPSDNPCISKCSLISINQVNFCFLIINTRPSTGSCKISTSYTLPADKSHWTVFLTQVNTIHPDYLSGDQVTQQQKPKARKTLPEEPLCCHKNKLCLLNVICFLQVFTSC